MDYTNVKQDDKTLNFLTGIPSDSLFQWFLSLIRSNIPSILKSFTMGNNLLILMKLKLGASNRDLSLDLKEPQTISICWFYLLCNHIDTSTKPILQLNQSNLLLTPFYVCKIQFISNKLCPSSSSHDQLYELVFLFLHGGSHFFETSC